MARRVHLPSFRENRIDRGRVLPCVTRVVRSDREPNREKSVVCCKERMRACSFVFGALLEKLKQENKKKESLCFGLMWPSVFRVRRRKEKKNKKRARTLAVAGGVESVRLACHLRTQPAPRCGKSASALKNRRSTAVLWFGAVRPWRPGFVRTVSVRVGAV